MQKNLARDFKRTIVAAIVSHDPKAESMAHRVAFLEDGRIKDTKQ